MLLSSMHGNTFFHCVMAFTALAGTACIYKLSVTTQFNTAMQTDLTHVHQCMHTRFIHRLIYNDA